MKKRWPWITYGLVILFQVFILIYHKIQNDLQYERAINCYDSMDSEVKFDQIMLNADSIQVLTIELTKISKK